VAIWHVFSASLQFTWQFSFHRLIRTQHLSSTAVTAGRIGADVSDGHKSHTTPMKKSLRSEFSLLHEFINGVYSKQRVQLRSEQKIESTLLQICIVKRVYPWLWVFNPVHKRHTLVYCPLWWSTFSAILIWLFYRFGVSETYRSFIVACVILEDVIHVRKMSVYLFIYLFTSVTFFKTS
jgi:hypothetical protein